MKKLFLIRHAKSSWSDSSVSDFNRKLNQRGKRDTPFMAKKLGKRGVVPDIIISSPAKRAKKTAKMMARGVGYDEKKIHYNESIYSSSTLDLHLVIKNLSDDLQNVFLVGHNYAITDLAEELSGQNIGNIPTTGIFAMNCEIDCWCDLKPGCGTLLFFDYPKCYKELR